VSHGTNIVLGLDPDRLAAIPDYLALPLRRDVPPLWDGHAGERAADEVEYTLSGTRPQIRTASAGRVASAAVARRPEPL
jgi:hypothetical protein